MTDTALAPAMDTQTLACQAAQAAWGPGTMRLDDIGRRGPAHPSPRLFVNGQGGEKARPDQDLHADPLALGEQVRRRVEDAERGQASPAAPALRPGKVP